MPIIKTIITILIIFFLVSCNYEKKVTPLSNKVANNESKLINKLDTLTNMNYIFNKQKIHINDNGILLDQLDNAATSDNKGNFYFVGMHNQKIYKINSKGTVVNSFGNLGRGPGEYLYVEAITTDNKGNIYVGDLIGRKIIKYDSLFNYLFEFRTETAYPFSDIEINSKGNLVCYFPQDLKAAIHVYDTVTGKLLNTFGTADILAIKYGAAYSNKSLIVNRNGVYYINPLEYEIFHYDKNNSIDVIKPKEHGYFSEIKSHPKNPFERNFSLIRSLFLYDNLFFVGISNVIGVGSSRRVLTKFDILTQNGELVRKDLPFKDYFFLKHISGKNTFL